MDYTPSADPFGASAPIVEKAFKAFGPTVRRGASAVARQVIDKAIANLQIGFTPYLRTSYDRCRLVKTLLSQERPQALLDIYVNVGLSCGDDCRGDDELIESLHSYKRVVITGLAGSGKSMFMKYLTICRFIRPLGVIPLFVELRQLNPLTSKKFGFV